MTPSPAVRRPFSIPLWLKIVLPIVVLATVWHFADGADVLARLSGAQWPWLAAAVVAASLQIVLSAKRWQIVATQLGIVLSTGRAVGEYYLTQLVNQTVPGGVVGDAARAVRTRHTATLTRAAQAVLIERMAGQIALFGLMAVAIVCSLILPSGLQWPMPSEASFIVGAALATAAVLAIAILRIRPIAFIDRFATLARDGLWAPAIRLKQVGLSLAIVGCNLASFAFSARATGTQLPLGAILALVPLILAAMLIPATIAGWGFREGAAAALFPIAGASTAAGIAASLAFGLVILVASLPGAFFLLRRTGTGIEPEVAVAEASKRSMIG